MSRRPQAATLVGWLVVAAALVVYWLSAKDFDSGRDDFFYLSDAFLHGRTWLERALGPNDVITIGDRVYVPFAPFPAIAFMPIVAWIGARGADLNGPLIDAVLAAAAVGLCWMLLGRLAVENLLHRFWLVVLFGLSTTLWWVTTRGGVWHTGQIVATVLTLGALVEVFGRQRGLIVGLLAGAAFLTRAPLALAVPFYALLLDPEGVRNGAERVGGWIRTQVGQWPIREWVLLAVGVVPSVAFFFWYNAVRFGSPFESGYALAALPDWLAARRAQGLFSLDHLGMNIDLLLFHLPFQIPEWPYWKPDGLGMSVLLTSPGLLIAAWAPWREPKSWWLLGAAVAVLVPTLLYYGGGWLQYGYRYFLDSIPFVIALAGLAVARRGLDLLAIPVILWGVLVGLGGVYWVDKI